MTAVATWFTQWRPDGLIPNRSGISHRTNIDSREKPDPYLRYPRRKSCINDLWWVPPPSLVETIVAQDFPPVYRLEPVTANTLMSRVSGATETQIDNAFPKELIKAGKAKVLKSRWP